MGHRDMNRSGKSDYFVSSECHLCDELKQVQSHRLALESDAKSIYQRLRNYEEQRQLLLVRSDGLTSLFRCKSCYQEWVFMHGDGPLSAYFLKSKSGR
ncbi:hypothetical protein [Aliikangiella sp. G2MR2-5]|uniref:hypothetical protein n=1 Tax=Aliikangiella sp. G2MR2-5 TaxID=2788943 RepID=UPI0018A8B9A4|nr:hypothetical protein [Aliikangiella sp. G2MR2-5]